MRKNGKNFVIISLISIISSIIFLSSCFKDGLGFPFDDAWIHQIYATNFSLTGLIMYNFGEITLGESSYFWMVICSTIYLFNYDTIISVFFILICIKLGSDWLIFDILSLLIQRKNINYAEYYRKDGKLAFHFTELFIIINPISIWFFMNGMETGLAALLIELNIYIFLTNKWIWMNLTLPLLFFTRGETIFFCIIMIVCQLIKERNDTERQDLKNFITYFLRTATGMIIGLLVYTVYHFLIAGQLFPNTFLLKLPIMSNLENLFLILNPEVIIINLNSLLSWDFISIALIMGVFLFGMIINIKKDFKIFMIEFSLVIIVIFAYFSSMNYPIFNNSPYYLKYWIFVMPIIQLFIFTDLLKFYYIQTLSIEPKGQYSMNLILYFVFPLVLFIIFLIGLIKENELAILIIIMISFIVTLIVIPINYHITDKRKFIHLNNRKMSKIFVDYSLFFIFIMIITVWPNRMQVYEQHIFEINMQHKQIGIWLKNNSPEDAIIATHDAGAIKFFSERNVIDIWGLNNQEIFSIYRNVSQQKTIFALDDKTTQILLEGMIWDYLIENDISYLIVREDLFIYLTNTSAHPELNLIHTFVVPGEIYLGNDTMLCYQII